LVLINHIKSEDIKIEFDFSFKTFVPFDVFVKKIKNIITDKTLLVFREMFFINKNEGIIKVVMGEKNSPTSVYLLFKDNTISYYPSVPYPNKANQRAYQLLVDLINIS